MLAWNWQESADVLGQGFVGIGIGPGAAVEVLDATRPGTPGAVMVDQLLLATANASAWALQF